MNSHQTTQEFRTAIPSHGGAPGIGRALVDDLGDRLSEQDRREAKLLVSEVVTDAVRHGRTDQIDVVIQVPEDELRVEVWSAGTGFPQTPVDSTHRAEWGSLILERMADAWGVDTYDDRTVVWFRKSLLGRRHGVA